MLISEIIRFFNKIVITIDCKRVIVDNHILYINFIVLIDIYI